MDKKKFSVRFTDKQILFLVVFGIVVTLASLIVGYIEFTKAIEQDYDEEASQIIAYIESDFNVETFETNMNRIASDIQNGSFVAGEEIGTEPGYVALIDRIKRLRESFDCNEILIADVDNSLKDEFIREVQEDPDSRPLAEKYLGQLEDGEADILLIYASSFGEFSDVNGDTKARPDEMILMTGNEREALQKLYREKQRQLTTTALTLSNDREIRSLTVQQPILNGSGEVIGFIQVDLQMGMITETLTRFMLLSAWYSLLVGIAFIVIFIIINRRVFIKPILKIIDSARGFVENDHKITKSLDEIKTNDEIQYLAQSILKMETDINTYIDNLKEVTAERERVKTELSLARDIQMSMLPRNFPLFPDQNGFDVYAIIEPAREVGGDFYNFYMIDEDHLGIVIGDVSGKGVPAALFMMTGSMLIKAQSLPQIQANAIIENVNDILSENNEENLFITTWMGIYEISTGTLTFVNAAHEPLLVVHEDGEYEFIKTKPNLALATFGGMPYRLHEYKLRKGDKLILYTDGVTEAQNETQEFYDPEGLIKAVKNLYKKDIKEVVSGIKEDVDTFVGEAEQFDDITIVGFEVK